MKTMGLLGGMSWESTAHYYRLVNETVRERLGGLVLPEDLGPGEWRLLTPEEVELIFA